MYRLSSNRTICTDDLWSVWGEELAVKMLGEAGFGDVRTETLDHDMINNDCIMTK